jgi:hypothetical protein
MTRESFELNESDQAGSNNIVPQQSVAIDDLSSQPAVPDASLPSVDGGKQAWLFLAACWVVEAFIFGELVRTNRHRFSD